MGNNYPAVVFKPGTSWVPLYADIKGIAQKLVEAAVAAKAIHTWKHRNIEHFSYVACFPTLDHTDGFHTQDSLERNVRCALFKAYRWEKTVLHIGNKYKVRSHATGVLTSFNTEYVHMEDAVFTRNDGRLWFIAPKKEVITIGNYKIQAISVPQQK